MPSITGPTPAVPWYIHPAEAPLAWSRLLEGHYGFGFAVVNIANGPGPAPEDPYYAPLLSTGSRTRMAGYVNVDYGQRPWIEVLDDVLRWRSWYGIADIMLDCVPEADKAGEWSVEGIDAMRALGVGLVIANPGVVPSRRLLETADITCVAEQRWETYRELVLPDWLRSIPPQRQWHLVHDVPPERLHEVPALAAARGAWYCWATDSAEPNPWAVLPQPYVDCHPECSQTPEEHSG